MMRKKNGAKAFFKRIVGLTHRRFGKDTTALVYACERCLTEKITVKYGAPSIIEAKEILKTDLDHIFSRCPEFKPKEDGNSYVFKSGSRIVVFGGKDESEIEKGRGTEADIIIISEFGFMRHKPRYMLDSILSPLIDETEGLPNGGQIIILSTMPEDLTHPYIEEVTQAEIDGYLFKWNIEQSVACGDVSEEAHQDIITRCKGKHTATYKREYMNELVADTESQIIPEYTESMDALVAVPHKRPPFFDAQVSMDVGGVDKTAILFGYYDFRHDIVVIDDEIVLKNPTSRTIAENIKKKEKELWGDQEPYLRVSDVAKILINDLSTDHDLEFFETMKEKGQMLADINQLRLVVQAGKIRINPKCKNLRAQMKYGIWNNQRTDFARSEQHGHFDCIASLIYFIRNIDRSRNPYPNIDTFDPRTQARRKDIEEKLTDTEKALATLTKRR